VPHKGSDQARAALLGNQVDMMFDAISTIVAHIHSGKLRALATTGKARSAVTLEVPTVAEAGVPGYEATIWLGLMAPRAPPRPVIEKLNGEVRKLLGGRGREGELGKQGAVAMGMTRNSSTNSCATTSLNGPA